MKQVVVRGVEPGSLSVRSHRPRTGVLCVLEELPTEEEMVQVTLLLDEITGLSAQGLTGTMVALSFSKRLVQPVQDRVQPGFEYWGHQDSTRGRTERSPGKRLRTGSPA